MNKMTIALMLITSASLLFSAPAFASDKKAGAQDIVTPAAINESAETNETKTVEIVTPEDIYEKVQTGEILLVCAYPDDNQFAKNNLKGAISFKKFESQIKDAGQSKLIVFY